MAELESRKLLCNCGKHHGTFIKEGFGMKCRRCKETTTIPYGIKNLKEADAWVEGRRRRPRPPSKGE